MNIGKENEYVEHKKSTSELNAGLISISSILNKHGKGTLNFGVKNNGDVCGQEIGQDTLRDISSKISTAIKPSCTFEINERNTSEGDTFIEVTFSGARPPYSAYGRYYIRVHDEDRQMDNDALRNYYLSQKVDYSEWETAASGIPIKAADEKELKEYINRGKEKGRINFDYSSKDKVLGRLGLLYDTKTLNNAGNVLFSKNSPVRIKLVRFAADTRLTILSADPYEGNIFECINAAMDFYKENIGWRMEMTGDIRRKEIPEIPLEAIREIVVNAFSHGNYNASTDFELAIYSNRVSIYSPGFFPKPYTPEQFASKGIEPIPLNNMITRTLFRDGTVEETSTGFERTFILCKEHSIDYEYEETVNGFRFTFFRGKRKSNKVSQRAKEVLDIIEKNPAITIDEITDRLSVSKSTVQRTIKQLKESGLLERSGSDKHGKWIVHQF